MMLPSQESLREKGAGVESAPVNDDTNIVRHACIVHRASRNALLLLVYERRGMMRVPCAST